MKTPLFLVILAVCSAFNAFAQTAEPEDLQFLIIEALSRNPSIAAELANMDAAQARVPQAGSLDDPELRVQQREMPGFSAGQAMASSLEFMQMIRFPTKLSTQSEIAAVQAEHAHHEHLEKVVEVIKDLKTAYAELWFARTALKINLEDQDLLRQMVRVSQTQYAVGRASQSDVLKLQIEHVKVQAEEAAIRQQVTAAESMLRALLNRRQTQPIGPVEFDSLRAFSVPVEALIEYGLANKPMLVHDSLRILESSLMISMAKQEYLPDFRVSIEYMRFQDLPRDRWSVSAGITIPFIPWNLAKASGRVEEAQAEHLHRDALFRATKNLVESGIRESYARQQAEGVLTEAYTRKLIPQTKQSLMATMAEYQTGTSSYLALIDSYRMYQMTRTQAAMARASYEKAMAELSYRVGVIDLSIIPMPAKEQ